MQFISCHNGKIHKLEAAGLKASPERAFTTGLPSLDALLPGGCFARGAVHELLFDPVDGEPKFVAALMAQKASDLDQARRHEAVSEIRSAASCVLPIIWSDPRQDIYPPALAAMGFDLARIYLLRTTSESDDAWAVTECLRCRGVGAVIASPRRLSRIVARRLQLAAEQGGAVGILLRSTDRGDQIYAAATRWKVSPYPGERTVQRWTIQLLHGHGGRVGQTVILEWCRETNTVRAVEKLADRPSATKAAERATA